MSLKGCTIKDQVASVWFCYFLVFY